MPANKDFKRLVRGRMQKTGESYTAARMQLFRAKPLSPLRTSTPEPVDFARLAGMSEATSWRRWGRCWDVRTLGR